MRCGHFALPAKRPDDLLGVVHRPPPRDRVGIGRRASARANSGLGIDCLSGHSSPAVQGRTFPSGSHLLGFFGIPRGLLPLDPHRGLEGRRPGHRKRPGQDVCFFLLLHQLDYGAERVASVPLGLRGRHRLGSRFLALGFWRASLFCSGDSARHLVGSNLGRPEHHRREPGVDGSHLGCPVEGRPRVSWQILPGGIRGYVSHLHCTDGIARWRGTYGSGVPGFGAAIFETNVFDTGPPRLPRYRLGCCPAGIPGAVPNLAGVTRGSDEQQSQFFASRIRPGPADRF